MDATAVRVSGSASGESERLKTTAATVVEGGRRKPSDASKTRVIALTHFKRA